MKKISVLGWSGVLLIGAVMLWTVVFIGAEKTPAALPDEAVPNDLKIGYSVFGRGPWSSDNYVLMIQADGKCDFNYNYSGGSDSGKKPSRKEKFTIEPADIKFLWKVISENKFFELDEKYDSGALDGSAGMLDITANGKTRQVETVNINVKRFDMICLAIKKVSPEKYRFNHGSISGMSYDDEFNSEYGTPDIKLVNGNNKVALDMYRALSSKSGNFFISPYSISSALAMTYAGARGKTETQIAKALRFTLGQELLHPSFAKLNKDLSADKTKGYQLNIANALWGQQGYKFLPDFLALTEKNYGAGIKEVDFSKDAESVRKTINTWVEKQTQDKIKELIKAGVLDSLTRLVLTNAIYFKGDWNSKFNTKMTQEDSFNLLKGEPIKTPLMHQREHLKYADMEDAQIIELPYVASSTLSMVVFLPKKADGITGFESKFTKINIEQWLLKLKSEEVNIYLPKFKIEYGCELQNMLGYLGMIDAFSAKDADFSGISAEKPGLYISRVIHKAFIDVNEEGTEAAAATAVIMERGKDSEPIEFRADHPFIFMIRDMTTGSILFIGRVMDPRN
jgi:serine protease inhibitor